MKDNTERMREDLIRVEQFQRDLHTLTQEEMLKKYLQPTPVEPAIRRDNFVSVEDFEGFDLSAYQTATDVDA